LDTYNEMLEAAQHNIDEKHAMISAITNPSSAEAGSFEFLPAIRQR
jgi:hypothetical protein